MLDGIDAPWPELLPLDATDVVCELALIVPISLTFVFKLFSCTACTTEITTKIASTTTITAFLFIFNNLLPFLVNLLVQNYRRQLFVKPAQPCFSGKTMISISLPLLRFEHRCNQYSALARV